MMTFCIRPATSTKKSITINFAVVVIYNDDEIKKVLSKQHQTNFAIQILASISKNEWSCGVKKVIKKRDYKNILIGLLNMHACGVHARQ